MIKGLRIDSDQSHEGRNGSESSSAQFSSARLSWQSGMKRMIQSDAVLGIGDEWVKEERKSGGGEEKGAIYRRGARRATSCLESESEPNQPP